MASRVCPWLRTGIQSGVLAGQGGKSGRQGLPTATPRSRRNGKTRQGPAGDLPNGPLKLVAEKRDKAGESQVWVTKSGGQYESWGHCENPRPTAVDGAAGAGGVCLFGAASPSCLVAGAGRRVGGKGSGDVMGGSCTVLFPRLRVVREAQGNR